MAACEEFYAVDLVMQETSDAPRVGNAVNRLAELDFFACVKQSHGAELLSPAVTGDVSFCDITRDITFQNDYRMKMAQVAVRRWKEDKIVNERFYYSKA